MNALPAKHFAFGPYRAESLGGNYGWWGVMNRNGFNCLMFPDKPGAVVTSEAQAKKFADEWNQNYEQVYGVGSAQPGKVCTRSHHTAD